MINKHNIKKNKIAGAFKANKKQDIQGLINKDDLQKQIELMKNRKGLQTNHRVSRCERRQRLGTPNQMTILFDTFGNGSNSPGIDDNLQVMLRTAVAEVSDISGLMYESSLDDFNEDIDIVEFWFGGYTDSVIAFLKPRVQKMHDFISNPGNTVTFVDARNTVNRVQSVKKCAMPGQAGKYGAVKHIGAGKEDLSPIGEKTYAQVIALYKAEDEVDCDAPGPINHIGSGMRIYLGPKMFDPTTKLEKIMHTFYHELTHKLLHTLDTVNSQTIYGDVQCRQLAKINTGAAMWIADSWAHFMDAFGAPVDEFESDCREIDAWLDNH
ncbi:MAG: hypothetical protein KAH18_05905 [Psychromonas sp.]|nr:hypothetical protein [Psychromonas sp.]